MRKEKAIVKTSFFNNKTVRTILSLRFFLLLFFLYILGVTTFITITLNNRQSLSSSAYSSSSTNILDMNYYVQKYGFYNSTHTYTLSSTEFKQLQAMIPYATQATSAFNTSFHTDVEPQLIVWWSYSEGINGQISFSNCNDHIYTISNCYYPASWQLGYGSQFSEIGLLKKAFQDMHKDPSNASFVQQVGQSILTYDISQHTKPTCGGYSCMFPQLTIDQIMNGVSTNHPTPNNWWASVLSRDPAINAYMNAEALQIKRFSRQIAWGWGSYYKIHWQEYSNKLATILANWQAMGGCQNTSACIILAPITQVPTPTPTPFPPPCQQLDPQKGCLAVTTAIGIIHTNVTDLTGTLFKIFLSLSGGVSIILIILSGYQLALSQGNPEKIKEAKQQLLAAIIGLLFLVFSVTLLQIIGIDILHLPGFGK